jgi:hypothetical protein
VLSIFINSQTKLIGGSFDKFLFLSVIYLLEVKQVVCCGEDGAAGDQSSSADDGLFVRSNYLDEANAVVGEYF